MYTISNNTDKPVCIPNVPEIKPGESFKVKTKEEAFFFERCSQLTVEKVEKKPKKTSKKPEDK
jgi:hypothetical protein